MSSTSMPVAEFRGRVVCRREDTGPIGLTLSGVGSEGAEPTCVAFSGAAPQELPDQLLDPLIERSGPGQYRISTASGSWSIEARAVHVHREVAAAFYQAVVPRAVPTGKRVFWRIVLALMRHPLGRRLLLALRRR